MKYTIVVDKQSRTNPSNEKREISFEIDELRKKGEIHDDLIIENGQAKVIRRIALSKYNVTSVLANEVIEELGEASIPLFEGDNYIYVKDEYNNQMCAEYIVKSDFTDMYVTRLEMKSEIEQTAQGIDLAVNKKLEDYSTTQEMQAQIQLKVGEITSTVSSTYATKGELNTAKSQIKQTTDSISSTVSKKVGNDEIISKINQSAEKITIKADKIDIDGKAAHFKTNIQQTFGPYTQADAERALKIVTGAITPTSADYNKYDINGDKRIGTNDLLKIRKAINSGGYLSIIGSFEIDPYSAQKSVKIYDEKGNPVSILSVVSNYFKTIDMEGDIDFMKDDNGIQGHISSEGAWFDKEGTNTSGASIGIGTVNGELVGRLDLTSPYGSIFADTTSDVGAEIILSKVNGNHQTIVKASEITTPKLTQTSTKSKKKNIKKLQVNALDLIKNSDICLYNLKGEKVGSKRHIGLIIGEGYNCPDEVISEDGQGVEQYSMTSLSWKAIQELIEENQNLKQRIDKLEAK